MPEKSNKVFRLISGKLTRVGTDKGLEQGVVQHRSTVVELHRVEVDLGVVCAFLY